MASNKVKDILEQNKSLAEQMRDYQQQAARDAYTQGQRGLSEQLRGQRRNMQASRDQQSQQAMLAQRNIQQGATSRGLGSSGIRDLASIQSQMAQGDSLSRLMGDNAAVQREAMNTRLGLSEQLRSQLMGTEAQYAQQMLDVDRFDLEREDMDRDTLMQLIEMASAEGANSDLIKQLAQVAFGDLGSFYNEDGEIGTGSLEDIIDSVAPGVDLVGDKSFGVTSGGKLGDVLGWLDPTKYGTFISSKIEDMFRDGSNKKNMNLKEAAGFGQLGTSIGATIKGKPDHRFYNIDGKRVSMSPDEIENYVNEQFKNEKYVRDGLIRVVRRSNGQGGTNIRFVADGKTYNTFNKAKNKLDEKKNK